MEGYQEDGEPAVVYLKLPGWSDVTVGHCLAELVGCSLAWLFGANAVAPVSVDIEQRLLDQLAEKNPNGSGHALPNFGVGSLQQTIDQFDRRMLKNRHLDQCQRLFLADLIMMNPDRRLPNNPNLGFSQNELIAFDFDQAFSRFFWREIGFDYSHPISLEAFEDQREHILFREVQGKHFEMELLRAPIRRLGEGWIDQVKSTLPDPWLERLSGVEEYLEAVCQNTNEIGEIVKQVIR